MTSKLSKLVIFVEMVGASGLLGYCFVLLNRVLSGKARNIGDDVVFFTYGLTIFLASLVLLQIALRPPAKGFAVAVHSMALLGIGFWLSLHLSGFIYSHGSMFSGR